MIASSVELPSVCTENVLEYLDLKDCLQLGGTSSGSLQNVIPNLLKRRNRMVEPYAMVKTTTPKAPPSSPTSTLKFDNAHLPSSDEFGLLSELKRIHPEENLLVFPTVQQRAEELAEKIPSAHSQSHSVVELRNSLRLNLSKDIAEASRSDAPKAALLALLIKVVCPLRLHAQILKHALYSRPNNMGAREGCPLPEYVGDVLAVAYLLNADSTHYCSSVEGSPTHFHIGNNNSYVSWVLIEAAILRTKVFSEEQRTVLGIPEFEPTRLSLDGEPTRLSLAAELYRQRTSAWSVPMDRFRSEAFMSSELTLVYDDFGPLGPSFRGRDVVRIRQISAQCMLAYLSSPIFGEAGRVATEWMCLAHEQAYKTRPMTVREPVVRFS